MSAACKPAPQSPRTVGLLRNSHNFPQAQAKHGKIMQNETNRSRRIDDLWSCRLIPTTVPGDQHRASSSWGYNAKQLPNLRYQCHLCRHVRSCAWPWGRLACAESQSIGDDLHKPGLYKVAASTARGKQGGHV